MPVAARLELANSASMSSAAAPPKRKPIILLLITCAGAIFDLWNLGGKSLWLGEGATFTLARIPWPHFAWIWWHGEANLQTIYFLLMRAWIHLGTGEGWLRLPSALFAIASIPLMYIVARKFVHAGAAVGAAALLAFSPTYVHYSQEARSYTLAVLLVLLSSYFFVRAMEEDRQRDWTLWTVFGILAFYSHDLTALVLVAQALSLFWKAPPVPWRRLMLCGLLIFVAALPGLTYVFRAAPENLHFIWMPSPHPRELWHLAMFFGGSGIKVAVALVLWVAGLLAVWRSRRSNVPNAFWRGMLTVLWAAVPVAILAFISLRHPIFVQRYMIFSLPALVLLASYGANALHRWNLGVVLVAVLCAMAVPSIVRGYHKPREDWRGASNAVLRSASPGDAAVFFPFYTRIMLDYYSSRYPGATPPLHVFAPPFYAEGEDARTLLHSLDRNPHEFRHVWVLMADHGTKAENFAYGAEVKAKLQSIYGDPAVSRFAEVDVLKYGHD